MVRSFLRSLCVTTIAFSAVSFAGLEQANAATYQEKLSAYRSAYSAFQVKSDRYWAEISRKKKIRSDRRKAGKTIKRKHFVLSHPPKYTGPKRPKNPNAVASTGKKKKKRSTLPRANDLRAAMRDIYGVKLLKYKEKDYKLAFAREAKRHGVSAEQVIGVYALETGGLGPYDRVSGEIPRMNRKCRVTKYVGRPASTALGYFQLLSANTSATVHGNMRGPKAERISTRLRAMAKQNRGKRKRALKAKAKLVEIINADMKKYIARYSGKKNNWAEFRALGRTKLGRAIHALNLDLDIGPMIQMTKLNTVRNHAIKIGLGNVESHRLELMNLVGYGRGGRMQIGEAYYVPTANFMKENELRANPVMNHKTVEEAVATLRRIIGKRKQECGSEEFYKMWKKAS